MPISKTIQNLLKKTNKKEFNEKLIDEIVEETKNNIDSGKNANLRRLIRPKHSNNKPLNRTGKLYKSIKSTKTSISMLKYGLYLNDGTKNIKKREFIPGNGTIQLSKILNKIIGGK